MVSERLPQAGFEKFAGAADSAAAAAIARDGLQEKASRESHLAPEVAVRHSRGTPPIHLSVALVAFEGSGSGGRGPDSH
jgi:hypothetical protein